VRGDDDLLGRMRTGDDDAFAELVGRYHTRLVGLAFTVVGSREIAEEVVQETWIAVMRGVEAFEGRSSLRTWLFRICVNRARTAAGREYRTVPVDVTGLTVDPSRFSPDGQWSSPPEDWTAAIDDRIAAASLAAEAKRAIETLPDTQRQVVTLRDVDGLSSREVCEVLSIGTANERVLLHRGRSRVRAILEFERKEG
jgi:RNA polymerase sigma-70 factor, ECF subfamily